MCVKRREEKRGTGALGSVLVWRAEPHEHMAIQNEAATAVFSSAALTTKKLRTTRTLGIRLQRQEKPKIGVYDRRRYTKAFINPPILPIMPHPIKATDNFHPQQLEDDDSGTTT